MTKHLPDYMGTWRTPLGETGRFFYFVEDKKIVDSVGLAEVLHQEISGDKIIFTKKYFRPKRDGAREEISYEGEKRPGHNNYSGTYTILDPNDSSDEVSGTFSMEPYSSLGGMDLEVECLINILHSPFK